MNHSKTKSVPRPSSDAAFLLASLFVTGLCSLALEIVGTRLISPFYGSSIYTWSALITTTMVALAAGYAWGGRLVERDPSPALFARLLLGAAFAVALIPVVRETALRATAGLGLQLGSLAAAGALIGPALVLIGMTGPVVTRLTATSASDAGRRAGDAFAVSTVGSVAGAALTGFVLVPRWPASRILWGCAAVLAALGAWGRARAGARGTGAAAAAAACALLLAGARAERSLGEGDLERVESLYGRIDVVEGRDARYMLVNGTAQAEMDRETGLSSSGYDRALEWSLALRPKARRALSLGLGAGLLTKGFEGAGTTMDAIEIDPEVARLAREHFAYRPKGRTLIGDARTELERAAERWDVIALDAFGSEAPPAHLFTVEAFSLMRDRLTPDGVLVVNLVSGLEGAEGRPWRAAYRTLSRAFPKVRAFVSTTPAPGIHNVLFFASTGPLDAPAAAAPPEARPFVARMLERELVPTPEEWRQAPEMTDDYSPLDFLLAGTAARSRRVLQAGLPEVLLR